MINWGGEKALAPGDRLAGRRRVVRGDSEEPMGS